MEEETDVISESEQSQEEHESGQEEEEGDEEEGDEEEEDDGEEEKDESNKPHPKNPSRTTAPHTSIRNSNITANAGVDKEGKTEEDLQRRRQNVKALMSNSLQLQRASTNRFLSVQQSAIVLRQQFVSPKPGAGPGMSGELQRRLIARKHFVPWGQKKPFTTPLLPSQPPPTTSPTPPPPKEELPEGIEPLVLWAPPTTEGEQQQEGIPKGAVVVDPMLVRWLRPHQREGVAFMFECVAGLRLPEGSGCILADDMGLGKTLQGLALLWTLVTDGHPSLGGKPMAKRTIIVCPTSLVSNWDSESTKWLKGRLSTLALSEASREDVMSSITRFLHPSNPYKVLILSYETLRLHSARLQQPGACDLLICDEAHRLKNDATLTNRALSALPCKRRVLLSGTPMQNHLDEFYSMVDFCNPGILGGPAEFRRRFEGPILAGREPGASPEVVADGEARSGELSELINTFILRRTNTLLSAHLPPKVIEVVCCQLTPLQTLLYNHFLASKAARKILGGKAGSTGVLPAISNLKKLCNHPKLIYDAVHSKVPGDDTTKGSKAGSCVAGFENVAALFPPLLFDDGRPGRGGMASGWELSSGKFAVAARMLHLLASETDERIVIVSNYTQTLDLFAALCRERNYPLLRLDGSTSISKREKLVTAFNDFSQRQFVFLLSSKAGGCGLNLVGANRLILYDVDWNPAVDKQAAARVWRDGQRRRVYVYRFLATGTIEEKVFQRQISKEGLQSLVAAKGSAKGAGGAGKNMMSTEELRELFQLHPGTLSHTYEVIQRENQGGKKAAKDSKKDVNEQEGSDDEESSNGESEAEEAEVSDEESSGSEGGGGGGGEEEGEQGQREQQAQAKQHVYRAQIGNPNEDELKNWGHHSDPCTVPDIVMQRVAENDVSFVFSCQVAGKEGIQDTVFRPKQQAGRPGSGLASSNSSKPRLGLVPGRPHPQQGPPSLQQQLQQPSLLRQQPQQQQPLLPQQQQQQGPRVIVQQQQRSGQHHPPTLSLMPQPSLLQQQQSVGRPSMLVGAQPRYVTPLKPHNGQPQQQQPLSSTEIKQAPPSITSRQQHAGSSSRQPPTSNPSSAGAENGPPRKKQALSDAQRSPTLVYIDHID